MRGYYERGNRNRPVQETPRARWPSGSKDEDRDERGGSVDFEQVLKEVLWRLVTEGSISYRRIKRVFGLDDDALDDVRRELIGALHIATDLDGELLVWAADGRAARSEPRALPQPLPALRHAEKPTAPAAQPDLSVVPAPAAIAAAPDAERRQLTVMFCDLVESTALSTGMDPEDLRDVIASYQNRCSAAIRRYDGFVAKYMGDGILVYFGYPRAHEDEAERSARAGLDIVDAMAELNTAVQSPSRVELAVRIGIATGAVIVGDLIGEGHMTPIILNHLERPEVETMVGHLAGGRPLMHTRNSLRVNVANPLPVSAIGLLLLRLPLRMQRLVLQ
jgi:hypothetical protein